MFRIVQLSCIVALALMQTGMVTRLPWSGMQLELLPMVMVSFSLRLPFSTAVTYAVIGGFITDSFSAGPWGFSSILLVAIVIVLDRLRHIFFLENTFSFFLCGFAGCLFYLFCSLLVSLVQRGWLTPSHISYKDLLMMDWPRIWLGIVAVSLINGCLAPIFDWFGTRFLGFPRLRFGGMNGQMGAA